MTAKPYTDEELSAVGRTLEANTPTETIARLLATIGSRTADYNYRMRLAKEQRERDLAAVKSKKGKPSDE